jgi:type II secretory pathway predicted ATPase ExeA
VYREFYGFRTDPFHVTPDTSMVMLTPGHREALAVIEYGLTLRKGFVVVTGEVGVGKTTVLRLALRQLDPDSTALVYVVQPELTPPQLLALIWHDLADGTETLRAPASNDMGELIRHILARLSQLHDAGKTVVIAIDEAQTMPVETLESLRLLSNLETDHEKFVQIVLAGQPELDDILARHELRQLNQRIAVRTRIPALTDAEAHEYIDYRVAAAGGVVMPFDESALHYLVQVACGNPRRLNIYCDNALVNGLGHRAHIVTREIAAEAIVPLISPGRSGGLRREEREERERPRSPRLTVYTVAAVIVIGIAIGLGIDLIAPDTARQPAAWRPSSDKAPGEAQRLPINVPAGVSEDNSVAIAIVPIAAKPPRAPIARLTLEPVPPGVSADLSATVPVAARAPTPVAFYTVANERTLAQLCVKAYGICTREMVRTLAASNPALDPRQLAEGQNVSLPILENLKPVVR